MFVKVIMYILKGMFIVIYGVWDYVQQYGISQQCWKRLLITNDVGCQLVIVEITLDRWETSIVISFHTFSLLYHFNQSLILQPIVICPV